MSCLDLESVTGKHFHIILEPLDRGFWCSQHLDSELDLLVLQGDGIIEHEDEVGRDLDPGHVNDHGVTGLPRLTGPGVIEGGDSEPVHDAVQDVGQSALRLKPLKTKLLEICY